VEHGLQFLQPTDSGWLDVILKLSSIRSSDWIYVDWWLLNHCSWTCSYCHEIIRNGSIDKVSISDCLQFVDSVSDFAARQGKRVSFHFTGGEVTEWVEFKTLVDHAKKRNAYIRFRSNAGVDIHTWNYILERTDSVVMELHPEHTLISKFVLALDRAVNQGLTVLITAHMIEHRWEEIEKTCNMISLKYPTVSITKKMLFTDPVQNTTPESYVDEHVEQLKNQTGDLEWTDENNQSSFTDYQTLVFEKKNNFKDWQCRIGLEQIVVDAWGKIYRGHCRMGGPIGNLTNEDVRWSKDPIVCKSDLCRNSFDIQATKLL